MRIAILLGSLALLIAGCSDSHGTDAGTDAGADTSTDTSIDTGADAGDFSACVMNSECVVVPASCCGQCGAATRGDSVAIHLDRTDDHRESVCGPVATCPACYMPTDPTLVATCNAGRCEVVDLRDEPLSECAEDADCRLRTQSCCECGGDTSREGLIAIPVAGENAYMTLVCDEGSMTGCPECAPAYPAEARALCAADGHCNVEWDGSP